MTQALYVKATVSFLLILLSNSSIAILKNDITAQKKDNPQRIGKLIFFASFLMF